jgi:hypothetical protein
VEQESQRDGWLVGEGVKGKAGDGIWAWGPSRSSNAKCDAVINSRCELGTKQTQEQSHTNTDTTLFSTDERVPVSCSKRPSFAGHDFDSCCCPYPAVTA